MFVGYPCSLFKTFSIFTQAIASQLCLNAVSGGSYFHYGKTCLNMVTLIAVNTVFRGHSKNAQYIFVFSFGKVHILYVQVYFT